MIKYLDVENKLSKRIWLSITFHNVEGKFESSPFITTSSVINCSLIPLIPPLQCYQLCDMWSLYEPFLASLPSLSTQGYITAENILLFLSYRLVCFTKSQIFCSLTSEQPWINSTICLLCFWACTHVTVYH